MMRAWLGIGLLVFLGNSLGCALCCSPFDDDYATYGTRDPRVDMRHGRSGSPFSDPAIMGTTVNSAVGYETVIEEAMPYESDIEDGAVITPLGEELYYEDAEPELYLE